MRRIGQIVGGRAEEGPKNTYQGDDDRRGLCRVLRHGYIARNSPSSSSRLKTSSTIGGPSYRIHNIKKRYAQWEVVDNHGRGTCRRMLYQERMRRVDDRIFAAFDFPDCGQIRAKRPVSTTPMPALNLMNGKSDEFGFKTAVDETTVYDFNATLLHMMGLHHERLTYYYDGLERRLTSVHGEVVRDVLA